MVGILFVWKRGKELSEDPQFQERMKDPNFVKNLEGAEKTEAITLAPGAIKSVIIFGLAVLAVVILGSFPELLPAFGREPGFSPGFAVNAAGNILMPSMIMMIMLGATGLIILFANTTAAKVTKASLFASAGQATIAVFGVVWMSSTFMSNNFEAIQQTLGELVASYPWSFAIALFMLSMLLYSQASTAKALMPLGTFTWFATCVLNRNFPGLQWSFLYTRLPNTLNRYSV
jgi:anaerobic C4-dicarboxylate transporter DcuA